MSRILHHVGAKQFKKVYQRKLDEQNLLWQEEQKKYSNIQEIKRISERFKSDWRTELAEAMSSKDFPYIYGGVVTVDILSLTNLPGSQFAQNSIQSGANQTDYAFGSEFPGSYVNSIGDIPNVVASAVDSWDSVNDLVPSGWEPENSDEYQYNEDGDFTGVVSFGQETAEFKDTHFGEVHLSGDRITIHTGDDGDPNNVSEPGDSTIDIEDLKTLFPRMTFPRSLEFHGYDVEDMEPAQASMLLRTFKDARVGDKISFNYSFDTLETEEEDVVTYRGGQLFPAGDDSIMDDYAFVIVGDSMKGKIVSVLARDGNNIDFDFQLDGFYYKPDVLQGRFPLTGKYEYTVTKDDIDDYGNVKFFIGVMDSFWGIYQSTLDITSLKNSNRNREAAGKLGKVTGGYDLGAPVSALDPNKKKKKDDETDSTGTKSFTTFKKDVESANDSEKTKQKEKEIIDQEIQDKKEVESVPQYKKEEEKILDDAKKEEQREDKKIEKEKESDERKEEKEKLIDEFEGDKEEKNIFSQLLDSALDYAAEITGHKTSKAVLDLYNKFLNDGANKLVKYDENATRSVVDWEDAVLPHHTGIGGWTGSASPVVRTNKDGEVDLRKNRVISDSDMTYLRSALNDSSFEKMYERAMNANNEKSKQLYLHSLANMVEAKVQNQILNNKGLRNSLFDGVKLDRNAFLQSNGKYISFTKDYQFRPGGSVAKAEETWLGRALTALGIDLDTLGSGNLIDKVGGVVASKLLTDGANKFGGLYNAPPMRMRLNLHYRGAGNTGELFYKSSTNPRGYVNRGAWWEEDPEVGKKELSSYEYSQNWTPEAIGPYHSLNPRTGQWERPGGENWTGDRFGQDWEGQTDRERALKVQDDFWWLDPNFKDLTKFDDTYDKKDDEPVNDVSGVNATDAATLASERKKKKRGQGGRKLGDTTKRGGVSEQLYPGQPSPNGFPDNPPAQLAPNGYHPEFGKRANRYRTLDPISAKTMARVMTGDPETDSQVAAAARQPKVAPQKSTTWRRAKKHLRRA